MGSSVAASNIIAPLPCPPDPKAGNIRDCSPREHFYVGWFLNVPAPLPPAHRAARGGGTSHVANLSHLLRDARCAEGQYSIPKCPSEDGPALGRGHPSDILHLARCPPCFAEASNAPHGLKDKMDESVSCPALSSAARTPRPPPLGRISVCACNFSHRRAMSNPSVLRHGACSFAARGIQSSPLEPTIAAMLCFDIPPPSGAQPPPDPRRSSTLEDGTRPIRPSVGRANGRASVRSCGQRSRGGCRLVLSTAATRLQKLAPQGGQITSYMTT